MAVAGVVALETRTALLLEVYTVALVALPLPKAAVDKVIGEKDANKELSFLEELSLSLKLKFNVQNNFRLSLILRLFPWTGLIGLRHGSWAEEFM